MGGSRRAIEPAPPFIRQKPIPGYQAPDEHRKLHQVAIARLYDVRAETSG
jgi:hypothetical protein